MHGLPDIWRAHVPEAADDGVADMACMAEMAGMAGMADMKGMTGMENRI